jgi:ABC-2 type transport system permease protein
LVKAGDKEVVVNLVQTRIGSSDEEQINISIQNLEYAFTSAIKKAVSGGKPQVGFTEGHYELTDVQLNDAMKSLSDGFEVGRVKLATIPLRPCKTLSFGYSQNPTASLPSWKSLSWTSTLCGAEKCYGPLTR